MTLCGTSLRSTPRALLVASALALPLACADDGTTSASSDGSTSTTSTSTSTGPTTTTTDPTTSTTTDTPTSTVGMSDSDGTSTSTSSTGMTTGEPGVCGDGQVDAGEECDDGDDNGDDKACTSACAAATCGDGLVLTGTEECDDGNADDTDACVAGCKSATCGDGFIGPGEACDDGNDVDDDACGNDCALGSCGDGKLQAPEECDDGNMDDTDACLSTCLDATCGDTFVQAGVEECDDANADDTDACVAGCKSATCGDGFIQTDVEECDDGNMSEFDECTTSCKTPTCTDTAQNGSESDVDCGGSCPDCGNGKKCTDNNDCTSTYCDSLICATPPTCKALKQQNPAATSGVYTLDPDGNGPVTPFMAYCEMDFDGGGWTLALKANGLQSTFAYDQALWLNSALHMPNNADLDHTEAKLSTWNTIAFTEVLLGLEYPINNGGKLQLKFLKLALPKASLFALFSPNTYSATNAGRPAWKALVVSSSLQPNCNREGANSHPSGNNAHTRARLGIVTNQENDCASPDSFLGIGTAGVPCGGNVMSVGNMSRCSGDNGDVDLPAWGAILVR